MFHESHAYLSTLGYQNPAGRGGWLVQRTAEAYNTQKVIYCAGLRHFPTVSNTKICVTHFSKSVDVVDAASR